MSQPASDSPPVSLDEIGHPRGTLAILAIYMLLFVIGWLGLYFYEFLPRGTPDSLESPPAHSQSHTHPMEGGQP